MNTEEKFVAAVNVIKSLPKDGPYQPSHEMMLKFYGLYKQATEGPCNQPKPAFYELVRGYKWKAWNSLGQMQKEEAMFTYVDELKKIVETMHFSDDVADFIESLGPFYEFVDFPVTNGKSEDRNHNVADFQKREKAECNGKPFKLKEKLFDEDDRDSPYRSFNAIQSNEMIHLSNGECDILLQNGGDSEDCEDPLALTPESSISPIDIHQMAKVKKLLSDTDTDDEYSEPAEFIEIENAPVTKAVACGGGDVLPSGRNSLTPTHSGNQGSGSSMPDRSSSHHLPSRSMVGGGAGGGGRDGRNSGGEGPSSSSGGVEVNAQLLMILQRIHQDLQAVVLRLDSLEAQSYNQHADMCSLCQRRGGRSYGSSERSWWPFPELSPRSTFILLTWPLILPGAIKLLLFLKSRRRRKP